MKPVLSFLIALAGLKLGAALGQKEEGASGLAGVLGEQFSALDRSLHEFDWEAEAEFFNQAIERVFENNGWTSESHIFAREVAKKVASVPPWDLTRRLETVAQAIRERYGISQESAARFQGSMLRETTGLFLRHARTVIAGGNEMLATRRMNKAITAEQVARWSRDSRGFLRDAFAAAERLHDELSPMVPAERQELWRLDWESYGERRDLVDRMVEEWAQGRWQPSHWGLDQDPIQADAAGEAQRSGAGPEESAGQAERRMARPGETLPPDHTRCKEDEPATWYVCVREFCEKYKLDAAQSESARSIHDEVTARAAHYLGKHPYVADTPDAVAGQEPRLQVVRELFAQLANRLDALPTTSQKQNAGE